MDFFDTVVGPNAAEFVNDVLARGRLSEGECVRHFETRLSQSLGLTNPVALNSGTSALHLALVLCNIGPGDEVIIPAQTFVATGLAVLMTSATPVFADIDPQTGNLDPADVARRVTERTRAILPVHWAGLPCDMQELGEIAAQHQLPVIEDAAHALGAKYRGQPVGAISRFTCFSFQAIKHLTTGDGGALCCLSESDHRSARKLRWFGIERDTSPVGELGERVFDLEQLGYKYHLNDLSASVGLSSLLSFEASLSRRHAIAARYRSELSDIPGFSPLPAPADRTSADWLFPARVERRLSFVRALSSRGIPTSVVHQRIDRFTLFGGIREDLTGTFAFDESQIHLPLHSSLTDDDVTSVIEAVRHGW